MVKARNARNGQKDKKLLLKPEIILWNIKEYKIIKQNTLKNRNN